MATRTVGASNISSTAPLSETMLSSESRDLLELGHQAIDALADENARQLAAAKGDFSITFDFASKSDLLAFIAAFAAKAELPGNREITYKLCLVNTGDETRIF